MKWLGTELVPRQLLFGKHAKTFLSGSQSTAVYCDRLHTCTFEMLLFATYCE